MMSTILCCPKAKLCVLDWVEDSEQKICQLKEILKETQEDVKKLKSSAREQQYQASYEAQHRQRIDAMARIWNILPGWSLDLTDVDPDDGRPWDLAKQDKRDKAERMVRDKAALLLIGSPLCSAASSLADMSKNRPGNGSSDELSGDALTHLRFCMKLYKMQSDNGLYFIHEHPRDAPSWNDVDVKGMMRDPRIYQVMGDICCSWNYAK